MNDKNTVREFIREYTEGYYESSDLDTMIDAGWFDWSCEDKELKPRLDALFPKVYEIVQSSRIDKDTMYVFFKNNCPACGEIYDDFRICDIETGDVVFTIIPASGHTKNKGQAELWGSENDFEEALVKGRWMDIKKYFDVEKKAATA